MTIIGPAVRALCVGAGLAFCAGTPTSFAQDADWPCVQRLVPTLEPGLVWSGPALEPMDQPRPELQVAARRLIDPQLSPEAVTADVKSFAEQQPEAERGKALTQLFALSFDWLNDERSRVLRGIHHYAAGQKKLADRIVVETRELEKLQSASSADNAAITDVQATRDWDLRIYADRQKSLSLVCEQPVQLEQRAFALARIIQDQLP
ncbi:MAG: hypothetical protein AB7I59_09755 [Geminicoccaceae bacterium]